MGELIIGAVTLVATAMGVWFTYASWKVKELRKDEILAWSMDCIDILQRTHVLVSNARNQSEKASSHDAFLELQMRSSVQVERGRLFFLNVKNGFGSDKPLAYQGLRPVILDCLVANCQICEIAPTCAVSQREALGNISLKYTREFVGWAQAEVGRSQMSKSGAADAGSGIDIKLEMQHRPEQPVY